MRKREWIKSLIPHLKIDFIAKETINICIKLIISHSRRSLSFQMYYLQSVSQFFSQGVVKEGRSQEARLPFEIFKRHRFPQALFDANYRDNKSKNRNFCCPEENFSRQFFRKGIFPVVYHSSIFRSDSIASSRFRS